MIDWRKNKDWGYLLGVIHGDGYISDRAIRISVGYADKEYADYLMELILRQGLKPHLYSQRSCLEVTVNSQQLTDELRPYKQNGIWYLPQNINEAEYVAGVIDTDGCVTNLPSKRIVIGLKKSGNLLLIKKIFDEWGMQNINIKYPIKQYKGHAYEIEQITLHSFHNLTIFSNRVNLHNPKKTKRLVAIVKAIEQIKSAQPIWKKVAKSIQNTPKNADEIMEELKISRPQFDSAIQKVKRDCQVRVIPPNIKFLIKYVIGGTL